MALTEEINLIERIEILADGSLQIREATTIARDGVTDSTIPARYFRYVLHPGDDVTGKHDRIVAIAGSVWTPDVVAAFLQKKAAMQL